MKKLAITLTTIGIASLGYTQNPYPNLDRNLTDNIRAVVINHDYLSEVQDETTPKQAKYLENVVSYWDVTRSKYFDRRESNFQITFTSTQGFIEVHYDKKGKITSVVESFKKIALPRKIGRSIAEKYPSWKLLQTSYKVFYSKASGAEKFFEVIIGKDRHKETLKLNSAGAVIG